MTPIDERPKAKSGRSWIPWFWIGVIVLGAGAFVIWHYHQRALDAAAPQNASGESADVRTDPKTGEPVLPKRPELTAVGVNGKPFVLSRETGGKVVLLNFWATWCPPCRMEIPSFIRLYEKYKKKGFVIVGVSLDSAPPGKVAEFARNNRMSYPVVMGTMEAVQAYGGIQGIPTTFIINRKGEIVQKIVGLRDERFLEGIIQQLIQEKVPASKKSP